MKELVIQTIFPDDNYFVWQVELLIENLIKTGYTTQEIQLIVFKPYDRKAWNKNFYLLQEKYSHLTNVKFFYYEGTEQVYKDIKAINYIPLLRPYCAKLHYEQFPELKEKAVFYIDSDILMTKNLDFSKYLEDDVVYTSEAGSYNNVAYWDSKVKDVLPNKLKEYQAFDILDKCGRLCGISREIIEQNDSGTGAAQYLLKGVDSKFWEDVYNSCINLRSYLMYRNKVYFGSENKGIQSWCCDIWAVLWNLWKRGIKTECPKDFDFAWATDPLSKIDEVYIMHNAGVSSNFMEMEGIKVPFFYKGTYSNTNYGPQKDKDFLTLIPEKYCTYFYTQELLKIVNPII